jgi:phosphopantothenoylcysteine decarboxylase / phosphopantothenate---cysteine ligase
MLHPLELSNRHILLGLTGGIACYKAAELTRQLIQAGATVQVVMTEAAEHFVGVATMQALSGRAVFTSPWDERAPNHMAHINLSREADAILIAPASADFIAKLVQGRADDLLSLLCLARPAGLPLAVAPAMNREMWAHPATQRNVAQLLADGAQLLGPGQGDQACGEWGDGRMQEPYELCEALMALFQDKCLKGAQVLISAGPTYEAIDPVRGLTNKSSGKMGFAIARAAAQAGASVTLIAGPVNLFTPVGAERIDVQSAQEMHEAVMARAAHSDVFIATAAVADWRPERVAAHKIKKTDDAAAPLFHLVENPDILASVAALPAKNRPFCVGFAAESHELAEHTRAKRLRKGVPLMVGNIGPEAFGSDDNTLLLIDEHGERQLPRAPKQVLARALIAEIAAKITFDPPP